MVKLIYKYYHFLSPITWDSMCAKNCRCYWNNPRNWPSILLSTNWKKRSRKWLWWSSKRKANLFASLQHYWHKSSRSQMFFKIGVLKNFVIITGKQLCWKLFLIKLQTFRPVTLLKGDSNVDIFLWILRIF